MAPRKCASTQQEQVDMVMKEYRDIFSSPTGVLLHCQVNHLFDLTLVAPLPNEPTYCCSIVENSKNKQWHDQHLVPHKFQVGDKVWLHLQKERLTRAHRKLRLLWYGPYTITKAIGNNSLEHKIPPFLGLHPVFNADRLRPYFSPLFDTSNVA